MNKKDAIKEGILTLVATILLITNVIILNSTFSYEYYMAIISIIIISYISIKLIRKKTVKVINNPLDICVLLLVFSTSISLIFNTYVSLSQTVKTILQYILAFGIYITFKNIAKENTKSQKVVKNALIFSTLIWIIIGIDAITANLLESCLDKIGVSIVPNGENRLSSIFAYANTFSIYILSILFINMNQMLESKAINQKILYKTITVILFIGILLTYSKGVFLILPFFILLYFIILKNKEQKKEFIKNIIFSLILSIMFVTIFEKSAIGEKWLIMWIMLVAIILTSILANIIEEYKVFPKIKLKYIIPIFISGIAIILMFEIYNDENKNRKWIVFNQYTQSNYEAKILDDIKGNTKYVFSFELEAKTPIEAIDDIFEINILERDAKNQDICSNKITFGNFNGVKELEIVTNENTREIKIEVLDKIELQEKILIIKNLKINGKNTILEYNYLPTKLINKIKNIKVNYKTAEERIVTIEDALKIAKENILTGIGGNGWRYKYKEVQTYNYEVNDIHSYPAKIILEFGLVGILAYIGILIILGSKINKKQNQNIVSIILAITVILVHSTIDVDMEFGYVMLYVFGLMGYASSSIFNKEKNSKGSIALNIILILVLSISVYFSINDGIYNKYSAITKLAETNNLVYMSEEYIRINRELAENYEKLEKYERYNQINDYASSIYYYIQINSENLKDKLYTNYEKILNYKNKNLNNPMLVINKMETLYSIVIRLEELDNSQYYEITEKYIDIIIKEYQETKKQLEECLQKQYANTEDNIYIRRLNIMYDDALNLKSNYLLGTKVLNESKLEINENELDELNTGELSKNVLIYHTHASESYKSEENYEMYRFYRTLDERYNVIKIGEELSKNLKKMGFITTHNKNYYDLPSTSGAYSRAKKDVKKQLLEEPNIDIVLDIHRNSYIQEEHEPEKVKVNGEEVSPLQIVIGIQENEDRWKYNLKYAVMINKIANEKYPGLFKPIIIRKDDYSQNLAKCAILIEVGENFNMVEQSTKSMKYLAEIMEYLVENSK